jgi:hypothetical protein
LVLSRVIWSLTSPLPAPWVLQIHRNKKYTAAAATAAAAILSAAGAV